MACHVRWGAASSYQCYCCAPDDFEDDYFGARGDRYYGGIPRAYVYAHVGEHHHTCFYSFAGAVSGVLRHDIYLFALGVI